MRSPCRTYDETVPSIVLWISVPNIRGVNPVRAATARSVLSRIEGPATTSPSSTSTTPGISSMAWAISSAFDFKKAVSVEKILISTGLGDQVRSPIRSPSTPGNSKLKAGSAALHFARNSSITASVFRSRSRFSLTKKIARVRLGNRQRQPCAGPTGEAFHLRASRSRSVRRAATCGRFPSDWCPDASSSR